MGPSVPHWSVPQSNLIRAFFYRRGLQRRGECCGTSDPLFVAIVVDAHHQSAAEADESDGRLEGAAVGPEIHDADLGLSGAVRGLDRGLEGDTLL